MFMCAFLPGATPNASPAAALKPLSGPKSQHREGMDSLSVPLGELTSEGGMARALQEDSRLTPKSPSLRLVGWHRGHGALPGGV